MSIADKLLQAKQDLDDAYESGQKSEYDRFWDEFQDNGKKTRYSYAFSGSGWTNDNLTPKYQIKFKPNSTSSFDGGANTFYYCGTDENTKKPLIDMTDICEMIDWSTCSKATRIFYNAWCKNITCDFSNATNIEEAFNRANGGDIRNLRLKVSAKCTNYRNAFWYLGSNVTSEDFTCIFLEGSEIAANGVSLQHSKTLSKESIVSLFNALSESTSGLSVTLSKAAVNRAFNIDVDDVNTYPEGSEYYTLRHSRDNWTVNYL